MNTTILTTPSPELKEHAQNLHRNAVQVAGDVKNQAAAGFRELKSEASTRLQTARGTASNLYDSVKGFVKEHPFSAVGLGVVAGILLVSWNRK